MKKYALLLVFAVFMIANSVMGQNDSKELFEKKIRSYERMRTSGFIMAGIGSGLAIGGTVLLANAPNDYDDEDVSAGFDEVFQTVGGIICLGVGVGLIAGGVTLGSIGAHKVGTYRRKLDNLSLGLNKQGLTLTYRF